MLFSMFDSLFLNYLKRNFIIFKKLVSESFKTKKKIFLKKLSTVYI